MGRNTRAPRSARPASSRLSGTIAADGVDYVSIGALTKHVRAIDLSMKLGTPPGG